MKRHRPWILPTLAALIVAGILPRHRSGGPELAPVPSTYTRDVSGATPPAPAVANRPEDSPGTPLVRGPRGRTAADPATARVLPPADALWRLAPAEPALRAFHDWVGRYESATADGRGAMEAEGVALARERRVEMQELMETDPRRALEVAVPRTVRDRLPDPVKAEVETWRSGRGDYAVLAAFPRPGADARVKPIQRQVWLGGERFVATTYGRRLLEPTRQDQPLTGIALGDRFALAESPLRRLERAEIAVALQERSDPVCAVDGGAVVAADSDGGGWVAAEAAGEVVFTCGTAHLEEWDQRLASAGLDLESRDAGGAPRLLSAYTEGTKSLIFIRVDFPDLPGAPFSDATGTNLLNSLISFFREQSYHRAGFTPFGTSGSAMTPTLRMPNTAAYYGARDASSLRSAAREAARAAGYNLSSYNFDLICFGSVPGFGWAGLAYVGSPGAWIRASFESSAGVMAHELGHNYGLLHANFWDTGGESVLGSGSSVEYGDSFDTMGNASAGRRHFNTRYKNHLNWLQNAQVRNVLTNGTYRLFAMDATNNPTAIRALTVRRNSRTNYWIEARQKWSANNRWIDNGITLRWGQSGNTASLLLDTTPGSADGKNDAPVVLGRTFSDRLAGVHVTPLAKGGADPVWYDVAVRLGNPTNNAPPTVAVAGSAPSIAVNGSVRLTATAADPDDAQVAYAWDFGDGTFGTNGPTASKTFSTAGEYLVRCVVSDLRGGVGSDSFLVRVGSPTTVRLAGRILRNGQPVQGVRVYTSNTRQTFTDSDGSYLLAGLARGSYTLRAAGEDLLLTRVGFSNPLNVQSSLTGLDFEAVAPGDLRTVGFVPLGAEWRYYDRGTLPGAGWTSPAFDESAWNSGPAQLGYGDDDVVTTVDFGPDSSAKHITTWFRHAFNVDDPRALLALTLGLIRDDGAVVYLNGREVFRSNMPSGSISPTTLASDTVGGSDESTLYETDLDPALLAVGRNVLAVELHQADAASSDLSFQLQLIGLLRPMKDPPLATRLEGTELRIAWPLAAVGFVPQSAADPSGPWDGVDGVPQAVGGENVLRIPVGDDVRFFRLVRP